ncbi:hypothetical protein KM043_002057 [Ampulex compressa]|nr:hypothetical protein KM043_002057 [Ampulex compressa]
MFNVRNVVSALSRLYLSTRPATRSISLCANPLCFQLTDVLSAEPLKKKRKMDPAIIRQREERRRRKIEKQIRRLEKGAKVLKPITGIDIPQKLIDEKEIRTRKAPSLSMEEINSRAALTKKWQAYKTKEYLADMQVMDNIIYSQQRALDELKAESEELYIEAIQISSSFIPYKARGPLHTPPIIDYDLLDGEYIDITHKYEGES